MSLSAHKNNPTNIEEHHTDDLKINKWLCLFLYSVIAFGTSFLHGGFNEWLPIIYKTEALKEVCNEKTTGFFYVDDNISYETCNKRDVAISNLSTIAFFTHFFSSYINGYILDTFGERLSLICGQLILTMGFLFLGYLPSSKAWYVFFFLCGLSSDLIFLPLLKISRFFPNKESLIYGILGASRSICFSISLVLKLIFFYAYNFKGDQFHILSWVYICTCILFSLLVAMFVAPKKNKKAVLSIEEKVENNLLDNELIFSNNIEIQMNVKKTRLEKCKKLLSDPLTLEYTICALICIINLMKLDYYIKSSRYFFISKDYNLSYTFSISMILTCIPTPIFGYLSKKTGSVYGIFINTILGSIAFFLVLFDSIYFKLLSILFFFLFFSFSITCFICYIGENFPKKHFGKLCGGLLSLSSLFLPVNFYLSHLNVVYSHLGDYKYFPATITMNIAGGVTILFCFYLKYLEKKRLK